MPSEAWLTVPAGTVGEAVLRRTVRALCAPTRLGIDRVDDIAIVCEELLARSSGEVTFRFRVDDGSVEVGTPLLGAEGVGDVSPIVSALATAVRRSSGDVAGEAYLEVTLAA